jgi:hypothetical protein
LLKILRGLMRFDQVCTQACEEAYERHTKQSDHEVAVQVETLI